MNTLTRHQTWLIGGLLLTIMLTTRSHLFLSHIQDASWAIFFLVGFYIRDKLALPLFMLAAFIVDLLVIESKGGESYCFTTAYSFLAPAYASLWFSGRWFSKHYSENLQGLVYFVASAIVGIAVCDVISSGGFYWFSGRFDNVNVTEFTGQITTYMPMFMKTALLYLSIAAVIHLAVVQANKLAGHTHHPS